MAVLSPQKLGSHLLPFLAHAPLLQTVGFSLMILAHQMSQSTSPQGTCNLLHNRTTAWLCLKVSCPWLHSHARCQSLQSSSEITISAGPACSYRLGGGYHVPVAGYKSHVSRELGCLLRGTAILLSQFWVCEPHDEGGRWPFHQKVKINVPESCCLL